MLSGGMVRGTLVVAGTNGKTTTSALLAAALEAGGRDVLHNRAGSNMLRGIATTLCARATLAGRLRGAEGLTGLFEVDEAALVGVLPQLAPEFVVLTNLFRDQLDRYGELQRIADRWRPALLSLPSSSRVLLNADDPLIASLGDGLGEHPGDGGAHRYHPHARRSPVIPPPVEELGSGDPAGRDPPGDRTEREQDEPGCRSLQPSYSLRFVKADP